MAYFCKSMLELRCQFQGTVMGGTKEIQPPLPVDTPPPKIGKDRRVKKGKKREQNRTERMKTYNS